MANERDMQGLILNHLESHIEMSEEDETPSPIDDIRSFEDAMIMTDNKGLVITLKDGSEFQLQIVRSK